MNKDKNNYTVEITNAIPLAPAINDLFRPTTKLLGERLRDFVKTKLDEAKEQKRENNLQYHLNEINKIVSTKEKQFGEKLDDNTLLGNVEKIIDSINVVQDIDIVDKELSTIWHNLISDLKLGNNVSKELINSLKKLSPSEAKVLLQFKIIEESGLIKKILFKLKHYINKIRQDSKIYEMDKYLLESLRNKSIVEKTYWPIFMFITSMLLTLVYIFYFYLTLPQKELSLISQSLDKSLIMMLLLIFPTMLFSQILMYGVQNGFGKYKLTWLGRQLIKYVSVKA